MDSSIKYSYESLAIKKDLIKLREKWKRLLGATITLDIKYNESTGTLNFQIEVKE